MKMKKTQFFGKRDLSAKAWKYYCGTDQDIYVDADGIYYIGGNPRERMGTLEDLDAAFCQFQDDAMTSILYDYIDVDIESATSDKANGFLTENVGRDGKAYLWYFDGTQNAAIDMDLNIIDDPEEIDELFC